MRVVKFLFLETWNDPTTEENYISGDSVRKHNEEASATAHRHSLIEIIADHNKPIPQIK